MKVRFLTWCDGDEPARRPRDTSPFPTVEGPGYRTRADVPVPLRWTIHRAAATGLEPKHLAEIYELPIEWVEDFVADPGREY